MSINFNREALTCELRTSTASKFADELVDDPSFDYLDIGGIIYVSTFFFKMFDLIYEK
jgi:hypothetical protein